VESPFAPILHPKRPIESPSQGTGVSKVHIVSQLNSIPIRIESQSPSVNNVIAMDDGDESDSISKPVLKRVNQAGGSAKQKLKSKTTITQKRRILSDSSDSSASDESESAFEAGDSS